MGEIMIFLPIFTENSWFFKIYFQACDGNIKVISTLFYKVYGVMYEKYQ